MPVTIKPSAHGANEFRPNGAVPVPSIRALTHQLKDESKDEESKVGETKVEIKGDGIIQSSFKTVTSSSNIYATRTGFPAAALKAYNEHQHLEIRPDDIWLSILTQFNLYVNAHAEELRSIFVSHEGKKDIDILLYDKDIDNQNPETHRADWGKFAFKMSKLIAGEIKDASLREWMLPSFTTTTKIDQAVAATLMMSTLQKYFNYNYDCTSCGLPSVTLLGEKSDWETLAKKAERIVSFGEEPKLWYSLLKPVLENFVRSFETSDGEETLDFWRKMAKETGGSGGTDLDGWITAFCFWDMDGKMLYDPQVVEYMSQLAKARLRASKLTVEEAKPKPKLAKTSYLKRLSARLLQSSASKKPENKSEEKPEAKPVFVPFDATIYHSVDADNLPPSRASVPVKILYDDYTIECEMVAGLIGMQVTSSGEDFHARPGEKGLDTLSMEPGWWISEKKRTWN
ncbi:hypothetical protein N431DRAFT_486270 [Stipitochalara longipes BDJ]|nr:hypothetical protein N431DRAFT_486270 [Stipitochalara longipes BDJ]